MQTFTKFPLSYSTYGKQILVASTSSTSATPIHLATSVGLDEVYVYASNNATSSLTCSILWGGTTVPNDVVNVILPAQTSRTLIADGKLLQGGLTIGAYASQPNFVVVDGFVNRISDASTGGSGTDAILSQWLKRVQYYGGATPSANTQAAFNTFLQGMESSGLLTKMITVNCFAPDSLTASLVPLLRGTGYDIWANNNFTSADVSVNGLIGNTTNKSVDTGIQARSTWGPGTGSMGLTYYIPYRINSVSPGSTINFETLTTNGTSQITLTSTYGGTLIFDALGFTSATGRLTGSFPHSRGLLSGNYSGSFIPGQSYRQVIYRGSGLITPEAATSQTTPNNAPLFDTPLIAFGGGFNAAVSFWSPHPMSFYATHLPLTPSEFSTLFTLVQAMRVSIGGGYVPSDPITDWVSRVTYYGGATPSTNTQTALRTFYNGLVSNNLLRKMKVVNCVVPDNITASLMPLINQTGSYDPWINTNALSASNQGFIGNGSAWADTGFVPAYSYATASNAGVTVYIATSSVGQTDCEFGTYNGGGSTLALYVTYADNNTYFDCYDTAGGRLVQSNAGFRGYISANHGPGLSGSLIDIVYTGSSAAGHGMFMSSSTAGAGTLPTTTMGAMQLNGLGLPSHKVVSFFALHDGLNITESNAFYTLVQAMRTSIGGGYL